MIHAESGFNPRAVSPKGAQGLMQLMPRTASQLGVADAFDPGANVEGGTRYLRELLERYNFDLVKALAAYNAGPQRVEQYHGVPPYYETQAYVARIVRDFNRKKLAERKTASLKAANYHSSPSHRAPAVKPAMLPRHNSGSFPLNLEREWRTGVSPASILADGRERPSSVGALTHAFTSFTLAAGVILAFLQLSPGRLD